MASSFDKKGVQDELDKAITEQDHLINEMKAKERADSEAAGKSALGTDPMGKVSGEDKAATKRKEIIDKIKKGEFIDDENEIIAVFSGYASLQALLQDNATNYRAKHAQFEGKAQAKILEGGGNEGFNFKESDRADQMLSGAQSRALPSEKGNLSQAYSKQLSELKSNHSKELTEFKKFTSDKDKITAMSEAHAREEANLTLNFKKALREQELQLAANAAGTMADIANGLYELTGNKSIELFNLGKSASALQAEINGYEAATKTAAQVGGPWGVALGILVEIATQVETAKILAVKPPKKAEGGLLDGPSHSSGGMMYEAEGGEYIHRKAAVQTYGTHAMDAINRGLIPPSVMRSYSGGAGATAGTRAGGNGGSAKISITNLQDPRMIDRHLASSEGRGSVINFMGQNKMAIRKAIGV